MFTYFRYLSINFLKKKTTWLSAVLFWAYISLVVAIIPKILGVNPMSIWNNSIMDVSSYTLTLLAIVCAVFSVIIFRDGRDDGSELIIISKPISRAKIIAAKFISFFVWTTIIVLISLCIISTTALFGEYSSNNPGGMDLDKIPSLIISTFLGSMIIIILFGAISVLISMVTGKIGVMVGTIGLTVFLNLFYMIAPFTITSPKDYLQNEYGVNLESCRILTSNGKQINATWRSSRTDDQTKTTYDWAQLGIQKSSATEVAYLNIEAQMCQIYKSFGVEDDDSINVSGFGTTTDRKFTLSEEQMFDENFSIPADGNSTPLFSVQYTNQFENENLRFNFVGTDLGDYMIYSVLGQKADSFGMTLVYGQDIGAKFYNWQDLVYTINLQDETIQNEIDAFFTGWMGQQTSLWSKAKFRQSMYEIMENNRSAIWPWSTDMNQINSEQLNYVFLGLCLQVLNKVDSIILEKYVTALTSVEEYKKANISNSEFWKLIALSRDYVAIGRSRAYSGFFDQLNNPRPTGAEKWADDAKAQVMFGSEYVENWESIQDVYSYEVTKIFDSKDIIIFWFVFSLFIYAIAILVYTKTDFK